jgi:hypothetical protein
MFIDSMPHCPSSQMLRTDTTASYNAYICIYQTAFDSVPHDRLLTNITATGIDLKVVLWVKEFLLGRSQRVRVDGKSEDTQEFVRTRIRPSAVPRL